jgi:hypothetical protein
VFFSPLGIGSFWAFQNWNYTTSWESNAVPFYLAGARIAQQIGEVELAGWVVNGYQTYSDINAVPSGLATVTWTHARPAPRPRVGDTSLQLSTQLYFGPETEAIAPEDWLVYWDTWAVWDFDERFGLAAVWDLAFDRVGRSELGQRLSTGGALMARGTVVDRGPARFDLSVRPGVFRDAGGHFFGADQWLLGATATANVTLFERLMLRVEYRYDYSTAEGGYFYRRDATADDSPGLAHDQHTVFFSLCAWWDLWFG